MELSLPRHGISSISIASTMGASGSGGTGTGVGDDVHANLEAATSRHVVPPFSASAHGEDHDVVEAYTQSLAKTEHLGSHRQYWRDMILGVNDGLISTFLLVAGVAGGGLTGRDVLLTALAGALAGAISMCAGEYVATKSQNQVLRGEIALERIHVEKYRADEVDELGNLLELIGIEPEDHDMKQELLRFYQTRPESLLKAMIALEFGVLELEERSPFRAGIFSGCLFVLGSLASVVPFCFNPGNNNVTNALIASAVVTTICLILVGAVKTWATRGNCLGSAMENLVIAGFGGGLAYSVGLLFEHVLGSS